MTKSSTTNGSATKGPVGTPAEERIAVPSMDEADPGDTQTRALITIAQQLETIEAHHRATVRLLIQIAQGNDQLRALDAQAVARLSRLVELAEGTMGR
jgi:hypothetical protein